MKKHSSSNHFKRSLFNLLWWITIITTPIFIVDIIIMTVYYVNNPWWVYVLLSIFGFLLGVMLSVAKYSYTYGRRTITFWGIPLPSLISDGTGNAPWWGFILNPLYFMLLVNFIYVNIPLINEDVYAVLFWIIMIGLVWIQLSHNKPLKK